jgi:hypothetical protein
MHEIIEKYKNLSESIQSFLKHNIEDFDDYLKSSYSVETLLRLNMIICKEILYNKNVLKDETLLKEKDLYITEHLCNNDDVKNSLGLLFDYIENNIDEQTFANKSLFNDLTCSLNKNNISEFAILIERIQLQSQEKNFKYPFVKDYIEDVVLSFNNQDKFNLFSDAPKKYEKYNLGFNEVELLVQIREFSKKHNPDKKQLGDFLSLEKEVKKTEEIASILKTKREQGFYSEVSFVLNNKPYSYVYDLENRSWNKDKNLIDNVLKSCEKLILNKIVQDGNIEELKDLIIMNDKREILGQKYLDIADFSDAKSKTINKEIIEILDNPELVVQEDRKTKKKRGKINE